MASAASPLAVVAASFCLLPCWVVEQGIGVGLTLLLCSSSSSSSSRTPKDNYLTQKAWANKQRNASEFKHRTTVITDSVCGMRRLQMQMHALLESA
jgi:hypothetical protein